MDVDIPEPFRSALRSGRVGSVVDDEAPTPEARYARGLARYQVGRLQEARQDLEAARTTLGDCCLIEIACLDLHEDAPLSRVVAATEEIRKRASVGSRLHARALHIKGIALGKQRHTGPAAEALLEASDTYRRLGERKHLAETYDTLGSLFAAQGHLEPAVGYYALSIAEKGVAGDLYGIAITTGNLGRLHLRAGRYADAWNCFELDLRISDELGDTHGRARMLNDMGRAKMGLEDYPAAMDCLRQCLELAKKSGYPDIAFFAHKDLALALVGIYRQGNGSPELLEEAERQLAEADAALIAGGEDLERESVLLAARGEILLAKEDDRALEILEKAARSFAQGDLPDLEVPTLITLAEGLTKRGYKRTAEDCLRRALSKARKDGYARYLPSVREAMQKLELVQSAVEESGVLRFPAGAEPVADGYTSLKYLGKGAFGEVYQALDLSLNRIVAIKRLNMDELYEPELRRRLLASLRLEMEAASRIRHPGIARVLRIGTDADDRPYLIMEYIEGFSLRQLMQDGGQEPRDVIPVVRDIACALGELHLWGIVHRDLKPENVLIRTSTGQPVLIDFGIAHVPSHPEALGKDIIAGTLAYMAPEQARGDPVTGQADIYSLGIIMYEWLTGALPIRAEGKSWGSLRRQAEARPQPILYHRPKLNRHLAALVDGMLVRRPEERPGAAEVARECARLLSSQDTESHHATAGVDTKFLYQLGLEESSTTIAYPSNAEEDKRKAKTDNEVRPKTDGPQ